MKNKKNRRYEDMFSGLRIKIMASVVFSPERAWALRKL